MTDLITGYKLKPSTLKGESKRIFNPKNQEDLLEYRYFVTKGKWRHSTCPFKLQWPYLDIPNMLHKKVAYYYVTVELKHKKT